MATETEKILLNELRALEGIMTQNPETGALGGSYISEYTNRIFGAPFQLMDSVDKRFPNVNSYLGNEYLRNFILNSPIIHIRPGMPKYTGGDDQASGSILKTLNQMYWAGNSGMSKVEALITDLARNTIFKSGSKLQRRMFGFRETYYDYMQHVNYMCRSAAIFLGLTESSEYPTGAHTSASTSNNKMENFSNMKWENYRMLKSSVVLNPWDYLKELIGGAANDIKALFGGDPVKATSSILGNYVNSTDGDGNLGTTYLGSIASQAKEKWKGNTIGGAMKNKISTVEFMVEPLSFQENLSNQTKESAIASAIKSVGNEIGSEIGFITNSNADTGVIGSALSFLGDGIETAVTTVSQMVEGVTGGFVSNLFTGAIGALKGQKMIYPKIYDSSSSGMNYTFKILLSSPYGDVYNYYMNIVVPLLHLIALATPRLVTANTTTSPYLVQTWMPGQCTCHLGIIRDMTITKNPHQKRVSVNGFPLEVEVEFTIEELYNAMSISPANDPASFLFNDTLNDYLANMCGLMPSIDTYVKQRQVMFQNLENYLSSDEWLNDAVAGIVEDIEDFENPFTGR